MAPAHSCGLRRQDQLTISGAEKSRRKSIDGERGSRMGRRSNYRTLADFFSAMHQSALCVRMKMSPSETAREALSGSPSELTASNSNFGLAFSTNVSPEWLMA